MTGPARTCPACGAHAAEDDQAFCGACGAPLSGSARPAAWPPTGADRPTDRRRAEPQFDGVALAPPAYRFGAWVVDLGVAVVAGLIAATIASLAGAEGELPGDLAVWVGLGTVAVDWVLVAGLTNGQTIGKRVAGTRVVRERGGRFNVGVALLRDVICRLLFVIPFVSLVDALMIFGEERKSLRDRLVSTRVVTEPHFRARGRVLAVAAVVLTVAAGGWLIASAGALVSSDDYTGLDREIFVDGCSEDGDTSRDRCGCVFDTVRKSLPYKEYDEANHQDVKDWSPHVNRVFAAAFRTCRDIS